MFSSATPSPSRSWQQILTRLATAAGAVVGLSTLAPDVALANPGFTDGLYLFGESPVAGTIGAVYFVFSVQNQTLSGALYQPSSSFDCVQGTVAAGEMQLTITDSYDQTQHPYTMALTSGETTVADRQGSGSPIQIAGLQPIDHLSDLDRQLLDRCTIN